MQLSQAALAAVVVAAAIAPGCSTLSGSVTGDGAVGRADAEPANITKVDVSHKKVARPTLKRSASVGTASWYGPGFRGKKTASGETFDDSKLTAAHKTLPLGSKAKVTNLDNGKFVKVEINDRGPFVEDRIIDLSRAAAGVLGIIDQGIAQVKVELLPEDALASGSVD
jgi:rare lipoprotein A